MRRVLWLAVWTGVRAPTLMRKVSVEDVAAADIQKLARGKSTRSTPRGTPDAPPWPASPRPCAACGALVRDRDAAREELAAARAVWAAEKAALVAEKAKSKRMPPDWICVATSAHLPDA